MGTQDSSVIVIGAGTAGLAAAGRLRREGRPVTLIEAGPRIGGRAHTVDLLGTPFDRGASWLHDAERNPLVPLATPADALAVSADRDERLTRAGRPADPAEAAAHHALWDRLDDLPDPAPGTTLADVLAPLAADPWAPLIALWEGAIIAAADADVLSAADWRLNRLEGSNLVAPAGIGAFIAAHLATDVMLDTPATAIRWDGPGVSVETPRGTLRAGAAVITVSTGVLAAGAIRFTPDLPADLAAAVHALPMGLLSKVVLGGAGAARLADVPGGALLADQAGRMTFNAWPQGRPYVVGFMGGRLAWDVAADPAAAAALAREELRRTLGPGAARWTEALHVTDWGTHGLFRGSYAYAVPGADGARGTLAAAFPGERLLFAGEATRTDGLAGTVGGAYASGIAAAERLLGR